MPASLWHAILAELYTLNLKGEACRVSVPTLSISGNRDDLFDASHRRELQSAIQGSRSIVMESHGHNPHWESPSLVSSWIRDFLRTPNG
jgi:pimeloyl-ACP methyl ester carboxylesterase